jgi:hypothetical protein
MASQHPAVGNWYKGKVDLQLFEVVAIDEATATVDIQYLDGDLAEFDFEIWSQLDVRLSQQPEDGCAPYELPQDGKWGADENWAAANKDNPVAIIESDIFPYT